MIWKFAGAIALLLAEDKVLRNRPLLARYLILFATVWIMNMAAKFLRSREQPVYVDTLLTDCATYLGLGLFCFGVDTVLNSATGRHALPVIPAAVMFLLSRMLKDRIAGVS